MNQQPSPGAIAALIGGVALLIGTFLDWVGGIGGANIFDYSTLTGLFLIVIAAVGIASGAIAAFAPQVQLPDEMIGFTRDQLVTALGFAAFVLSFSFLFIAEGFQIGSILATLGAAAIAVGGVLQSQGSGGGATAAPPQPF